MLTFTPSITLISRLSAFAIFVTTCVAMQGGASDAVVTPANTQPAAQQLGACPQQYSSDADVCFSALSLSGATTPMPTFLWYWTNRDCDQVGSDYCYKPAAKVKRTSASPQLSKCFQPYSTDVDVCFRAKSLTAATSIDPNFWYWMNKDCATGGAEYCYNPAAGSQPVSAVS